MKGILSNTEKQQIFGMIKQIDGMDEEKINAILGPVMRSDEDSDSSIDKSNLAKSLLLLMGNFFYDEFNYPQPQKGRYNIANSNFEKIRWVYRHWFKQLEVAEKESGLEEYFRHQILDFALPEGFHIKNKLSLSSGGDLLAVDVLVPENTLNLFDEINDFYSTADIVCANLESPVDNSKPIGRTQLFGEPAKMNTSIEMLKKFNNDGGINYFSTANNHSIDWGEEGLLNTLDELSNIGVYHSGTNRSNNEQNDVLVIDKNGIKVAMLSYTFDLNGNKAPDDKTYLVNEVRFNDEVCDLSLIKQHVEKAKEKSADIVIACCHWGWEFEMYPHKDIVELAHEIVELGVDVILGNHPHVSQPMESYKYERNGIEKDGLIVYSYGNFVAHHPKSRNSKIAYVTRFDIVKGILNGVEETRISNLQMLPIYILNEKISDKVYNCRLLKFSDVLNDKEEGGKYKYGLTKLERSQLQYLNEVVLSKILLPKIHNGILAE